MIPLAQKPPVNFGKPKGSSVMARRLGQDDDQPLGWGWTPKINVQTIGGLLLTSGSVLSMLISTDKRIGMQLCRAAAAVFGGYLVGEETWHPSQNFAATPMNTFVLPPLGLSAVIAGLIGIGYMAFGKKR